MEKVLKTYSRREFNGKGRERRKNLQKQLTKRHPEREYPKRTVCNSAALSSDYFLNEVNEKEKCQ